MTRFAHMRGFHVERRFGWDTHGLPVEYEIDKMLGITGKTAVFWYTFSYLVKSHRTGRRGENGD